MPNLEYEQMLIHLSPNNYQILAGRTINKELDNNQLELHALHGIASEVGEIHSIYQKVYQGHEPDPSHVFSELGDLLWFIAELMTANGWSMEDAMRANILKLKKRFPEGFEVDKSLHRQEGDI